MSVISLVNAALCDYHVRNCPPSPQLTSVCNKAFLQYHEVEQELRDIEWRYNCTDHNVSVQRVGMVYAAIGFKSVVSVGVVDKGLTDISRGYAFCLAPPYKQLSVLASGIVLSSACPGETPRDLAFLLPLHACLFPPSPSLVFFPFPARLVSLFFIVSLPVFPSVSGSVLPLVSSPHRLTTMLHVAHDPCRRSAPAGQSAASAPR